MPSSYRALCSDFYVNQKLNVKLDLPRSRETVLDLFERVRREYPDMRSFKRYKDEVALESPQDDGAHRWIAIRSNSIRSGVVNPQDRGRRLRPAPVRPRGRALLPEHQPARSRVRRAALRL